MSREFRYPLDAQSLDELKESVWDLHEVYKTSVISTVTDITTDAKVGRQYILADKTSTGTQTITLHSGAKDQQVRTVRKNPSHGGTVTTATEGSETIDGASTDTVTAATSYMWLDAAGEWIIL